MEFPSKATGHMVKRSGPLGSCFLKVVRPPRQSGSSLGWGWQGAWGVLWPWTPHMSNAKQQEAGQAAPIWAVCVHTRWGEGRVQKSLLVSAVRATDKL